MASENSKMHNPEPTQPPSNGATKMDAKEKGPLVVCFGEMLIDFISMVEKVSLMEAPAFKKAAGGAPANVAVGVSRLGGSSAFIGKVGDDEFGKMLNNMLKEHNVDNSGVRFDPVARTALAFVSLKEDGERDFMFFRHPSADMNFEKHELETSLLKKASIFHFGSISLITEPCKSTLLAAIKIAKENGCLLSYDPNLRLNLWESHDDAKRGIMSVWNQVDIIKVSDEELSFLMELDDPNNDDVVLEKFFYPNLKLLLVSEGKNGCRYYTKIFKGRVEGVKAQAVDTTGAGDSFISGILTKLASDLNLYQDEEKLREALKFANACGALTVTRTGGIPALPTGDEVQDFLSKAVWS